MLRPHTEPYPRISGIPPPISGARNSCPRVMSHQPFGRHALCLSEPQSTSANHAEFSPYSCFPRSVAPSEPITNKITRRWAKRGSRPTAPSDQCTASTYVFGAICPKEGKAVDLILPWLDTAMMNLHLVEISAAMLRCCSTRPVGIQRPRERLAEFMRDNWLSNRVFQDGDDLVNHCCYAWNRLEDQPWTIMSIGMRDWAHRSPHCAGRLVQRFDGTTPITLAP